MRTTIVVRTPDVSRFFATQRVTGQIKQRISPHLTHRALIRLGGVLVTAGTKLVGHHLLNDGTNRCRRHRIKFAR